MMQKTFDDPKPTLYIVSTPIGHLKDISHRAIETLKSVEVIYAEDTRTSMKLLSHHGISTPLVSYHDHNTKEREGHILSVLGSGHDIALISDAGTPLVSDPGYEMTELVIKHGYHVTSIPGASAMLAALVVSGLPTDMFTFVGFLPKKASEIEQKLASLRTYPHTLIIYESPRRIAKTLEALHRHFGNRRIVLARELTKLHESIIRTTIEAALNMTHDERGEYVLVIEGMTEDPLASMDIRDLVEHFIGLGHDEKTAMKLCAKLKNITKSDVYKVYKIDHQKS